VVAQSEAHRAASRHGHHSPENTYHEPDSASRRRLPRKPRREPRAAPHAAHPSPAPAMLLGRMVRPSCRQLSVAVATCVGQQGTSIALCSLHATEAYV